RNTPWHLYCISVGTRAHRGAFRRGTAKGEQGGFAESKRPRSDRSGAGTARETVQRLGVGTTCWHSSQTKLWDPGRMLYSLPHEGQPTMIPCWCLTRRDQ